MGLHRGSKGDFLGWNGVFDAPRGRALWGQDHLPASSVECPAHWGTCSGSRDHAKRQLGAKQESFAVKELKSLFFVQEGKRLSKGNGSFIWGEKVAGLLFFKTETS